MLKPFKRFVTREVTPRNIEQLQDNIEAYIAQIRGYPTNPADASINRVRKPRLSYNSLTARAELSASVASPKYVFINNQTIAITEPIEVNFGVTGAGGLDKGSAASGTFYYVYLTNDMGRATLIASLSSPAADGPFGVSVWTYLGSISLSDSGEVRPFVVCGGEYMVNNMGNDYVTQVDTTVLTAYTMNIPVTAKAVMWNVRYAQVAAVTEEIEIGPTSDTTFEVLRPLSTDTTQTNTVQYRQAVIEPQTFYACIDSAPTRVLMQVQSWSEDPEEYQ